jgi:hypothetical protein
MLLLLLIIRDAVMWHVVPLIVITVLAEAARGMTGYSRTGDFIGTVLMSFSSFGYYGQIWFNRAYTYECAVEEMPAGSTIRRIEERAYFMQDEEWVRDRKPRLIEDSHPHYHYVYGMGDKALDVSEAYGVSIGYSDLKDVQAGFHLRYLYTGEEVEKQKI